ncbi:MAG: U32 family peptidase C-terminal domain-containing protein [Gammaproteobacteria bacterium]
MKVPELLSPAGTLKNMRYAYAYGADAVYAGMPRYSNEAHAMGKQFFVATNAMPHGAKLKTFLDDIQPVIEMEPDALIMADPGLIMLVREKWPEMPIHLSVQANTVNAAGVKFWQSIGLSRVILSRELSLEEVSDIRQACPDMEIEVFVHGALCIAYSGRCLLSGYFNHRDANPIDDIKRHPAADEVYYLEEINRPGEYMPVYEDEHGTYIMNSRDLRAIEHVQRLTEIGVDCLKIEGRTKSHYYTARTTQVYRRAIDDAVAGRPFNPGLLAELESLANRGYTDGFFQRHESDELQNYRENASKSSQSQFVAEIINHDETTGLTEVDVKNRFAVGDELEMIRPEGNQRFKLDGLLSLEGEKLDVAPGSGWKVRLQLPVKPNDKDLITRIVAR